MSQGTTTIWKWVIALGTLFLFLLVLADDWAHIDPSAHAAEDTDTPRTMWKGLLTLVSSAIVIGGWWMLPHRVKTTA